MKYAEVFTDWLRECGYTHCFFVAGGNIMHLLDAVRSRMECIPFVHEVEAGIAAEYFNESESEGKAFALVTAGPGLTNIVTALAGAWLESRDLLVVGGQAKATDLASAGLRQRGIQEVDGVAVAAPLCVESVRLTTPLPRAEIVALVERGRTPRKGPVFLEVCLDVQGAPVEPADLAGPPPDFRARPGDGGQSAALGDLLAQAARPVLLIGGGVSRAAARANHEALAALGIPLMTTWNGADRVDSREPVYFGRPNTWGQRYANVILQQADVLVALGTRLGLQQTGFNWQEFAPLARVAQVDVDRAELEKGHPSVDIAVAQDADEVLGEIVGGDYPDYDGWMSFCARVRELLPLAESANETAPGYLSPYEFVLELSELCRDDDVVIPCSSGGAFTVMMQAFCQRLGQTLITNHGLASMGYGLGGAIGAAIANPRRRTVLVEGDGGFAQNLQELATVAVNELDLKTFIFANDGYASIRMTQRNYFGGEYLGCDTRTGLGFPDWGKLFEAYGIPALELGPDWARDQEFRMAFEGRGPHAFIVPVDPEQSYFPKISSRVTASGSMESAPLHLMSPDLPADVEGEVLTYLQEVSR